MAIGLGEREHGAMSSLACASASHTAHPARTTVGRAGRRASPWTVVGQGAAALAVGIGVGRFVYTPILPLMQHQAGLSPADAGGLATANYLGYLIGALAGILAPRALRSRFVLRGSLVTLVATLALMPVTTAATIWFALRLVAGVASALIFMIAVTAMLGRLRGSRDTLVGWGFGGVGAGIALSGLLVLVLRSAWDWRGAWWAAAALAVALGAAAWSLEPGTAPEPSGQSAPTPARRGYGALFAAYSLEGLGYIIAGTFLVAAIDQGTSAGWAGTGAWVLVGVAEVPSTAFWAWLAHRWSRPSLLVAALAVQSVGIALPALVGGVAPALVSAALFGATFIGIGAITFAVGAERGYPRAVALLTVGYSAGQVLGPLAVTPLLHSGYRPALLVGAIVVLAGAAAAGVLRARVRPAV